MSMDSRTRANPQSTPDFSLNPSATPGYQAPGNPAPNGDRPGFTPRMGESQAAARSRVIGQVLEIVRANGGTPAENG